MSAIVSDGAQTSFVRARAYKAEFKSTHWFSVVNSAFMMSYIDGIVTALMQSCFTHSESMYGAKLSGTNDGIQKRRKIM